MTPETAVALPDPERLGFVDRLTDRLSPILVRELQQALAGRAFVATLLMTVAAAVLLALVFAGFGDDGVDRGREAFALCIACMAPIALLIVPLQSFASMRQEVSGGTAEQLLMTRLRPVRIVVGKVLAGVAQYLLFLGVFAPLMALTFLLRGVDVPTIALILFFGVLSSIAANTFAIALASVGTTKAVQQGMQSLASAGLFIATGSAMAGAYELSREVGSLLRDSDFWSIFLSIVGTYAVGTWLCGMIATASLAHAYENRSSQFRGFAVGMLVVLAVWVCTAIDLRFLDEAAGYGSAAFALVLAPFWLWAACEEAGMSPRVRSMVPARRALALGAAPFLPGGGRGVLFGIVLAGCGVAIGLLLPLAAGATVDRSAAGACVLAWLYVPMVAGFAQVLRRRLPAGRRYSWGTFVVTLIGLFVLAVLPWAYHLMTDTPFGRWHLGHLFNPFYTVADAERRPEAMLGLGLLAAFWLALASPGMFRGVREVLAASAERRARAG